MDAKATPQLLDAMLKPEPGTPTYVSPDDDTVEIMVRPLAHRPRTANLSQAEVIRGVRKHLATLPASQKGDFLMELIHAIEDNRTQ